ncbi:MAG: sodium:proton antiporter [Chloroflexi bacterium]|nr:MAG: sodium:proton antiporter [Chloroflexota bacterium]
MSGSATVGAMEVFVVLVAAASIVAVISRRLVVVPYSVALVVLGVALAILRPPVEIRIEPQLILAVLLPALVFEGAYRTDLRLLVPSLPAVLLLAVPGVLVTAVLVGVALSVSVGLDFRLSFLVGTMVAATDPAAILAVMAQSGATRRLTTLVEAESLFNDGTGVVIFSIAVGALAVPIGPAGVAWELVVAIAASTAIGVAIGFVTSRALVGLDDHLVEVAISLVAAYGSYLLTAQVGLSGLIATVACGLVFSGYGRRFGMSAETRQAIDIVWEFIAFLATTLVFLLIGLAIGVSQLLAAAFASIAVLAALLVSRGVIVYGLLGGSAWLLHRLGRVRVMPASWLHVIAWSGLRGAVSVALALSLPTDLPQRALLQGIVFGTTLLTLVIQGPTARPLISGLRLRGDQQD